tara:strand:- start:23727 stop:24179 length:453 start_codon:yes stop_codon:yes gene_type:complete
MKIKIATILMSLFGLTGLFSVALAGTTIELSANDTMQFDNKAFEVPSGEEITLVFTNKGALPKAAMGHNVVILKPGSDVMGFGAGAVAAAATEYVPQSGPLSELVVASTKLLGPNETDTIKFKLDAPGEYAFICSFPGHYALMKGIITAN